MTRPVSVTVHIKLPVCSTWARLLSSPPPASKGQFVRLTDVILAATNPPCRWRVVNSSPSSSVTASPSDSRRIQLSSHLLGGVPSRVDRRAELIKRLPARPICLHRRCVGLVQAARRRASPAPTAKLIAKWTAVSHDHILNIPLTAPPQIADVAKSA